MFNKKIDLEYVESLRAENRKLREEVKKLNIENISLELERDRLRESNKVYGGLLLECIKNSLGGAKEAERKPVNDIFIGYRVSTGGNKT